MQEPNGYMRRKDLIFVILAVFPQLGSIADAAWHYWGFTDESFLTSPPHLLILLGVVINLAYHFNYVVPFLWRRQMPPHIGRGVIWVGAVVCFVSFGFDFLVHSVWFPFEEGIDAIYSFSHLGLVSGIALMAGGMFIHYVVKYQYLNRGFLKNLPYLLSLIFMANMLSILFINILVQHQLQPAIKPGLWPVNVLDPYQPLDYALKYAGIGGMVIFTITMTIIIIFGRATQVMRGRPAFTLFFVLVTFNIIVPNQNWEMILPAVYTGIIADLLLGGRRENSLVGLLFYYAATFTFHFLVIFSVISAYRGTWWGMPLTIGTSLWMGTLAAVTLLAFYGFGYVINQLNVQRSE